MNKPNIILIMTDQHRFDRLSCMGDPVVKTPNIDTVAGEGVLFNNAYTPCPVCSPARASIKSGMYPPGCGVVGNWVAFKEGVNLMTHRLQSQGYQTALCGKLHFVPPQEKFGFDYKRLNDAPYSVYADDDKYSDYITWLKNTTYKSRDVDPVELFDADESLFHKDLYRFIMGSNFRTEQEHDIPWVTNESIQFLNVRDKTKPFFLFSSFFGPHQPFAAPEPWNSIYDPEDIKLPPQFYSEMQNNPVFQKTCAETAKRNKAHLDVEAYKKILAGYFGQIAMIDNYIGILFEHLKKQHLWDDTLVIFVSDHGDNNGAYGLFFKGQMYDSCCKVPLLIKPPRFSNKGIVLDEVVNTLDLYGTILETAGDESWQQPGIEAGSLMSLLRAESDLARENRTFSIIGSKPQTNLAMIRRDNLKLIRKSCNDSEPLYELYDMDDKVVEVRNVFDVSEYQEGKKLLKSELDEWCRKQAENYPEKFDCYLKI